MPTGHYLTIDVVWFVIVCVIT